MKLMVRYGGKLSWGWLPPAIPMAPEFMFVFGTVVNGDRSFDAAQTLPAGLVDVPVLELAAGGCECAGS